MSIVKPLFVLLVTLCFSPYVNASMYTALTTCEEVPASNNHTIKWENTNKLFPNSFKDAVNSVNDTSWCSMIPTPESHWKIISHTSDGKVLNLPILIHPDWKGKELFNRMEWGKIKNYCYAPGDLLLMGEIVTRFWVTNRNAGKPCRIMASPKRRMHSEGMGGKP